MDQARQVMPLPQGGARPDPRAPQMPWLAIYLTVKDVGASLDFYSCAFGFVPGMVMRDAQGAPQHAEMHYKGEIPVMFAPEAAKGCDAAPASGAAAGAAAAEGALSGARAPATLGIQMPVFFYLYHDDVDALFAQARAAGAAVEMEPGDMPWGDRVTSFVCPNGYRWSFATHIGACAGPPPGAAA